LDTIAAISTAPGRAAIAVVRVSGPDVAALLARVLDADELTERKPALRWLVHPDEGERIDQVLATYYRAPQSYTGEDMLELSCHGGPLGPQLVLDAILAAGARPAQAGEFTRRAFLNGKLDLLQAEAVLDLVDGRSAAQHRAAVHQLDRGLSRRIDELREAIIHCEALLAYDIDFPEEDAGPVTSEEIISAAQKVVARIERLLDTAAEGELLRDGALTVIAGRPNAGKSSLLNALCGFERVIVTEEPGTTRDAVEAVVSLGGYPFRLVDTAGLRDSGEKVERLGIEVARRYLASADLVLFCVEAGRPLSTEEQRFLDEIESGVILRVRTKSDLVDGMATGAAEAGDPREVYVSTKSGEGLGELRDRLVETVFAGALARDAEEPLVTRARHARELRRAGAEVGAFLEAHSASLAPEVAATHLRAASEALEELIGVVAPEDLLARVFSEFCIGK
jgi:tRNA modification GTPase